MLILRAEGCLYDAHTRRFLLELSPKMEAPPRLNSGPGPLLCLATPRAERQEPTALEQSQAVNVTVHVKLPQIPKCEKRERKPSFVLY